MPNHPRKSTTIFRRVLLPLLLVLCLQTLLIFSLLWGGGVVDMLRENARDILGERVQNKYQAIKTDMTRNWTALDGVVPRVNTLTQETLTRQGLTVRDIRDHVALNNDILLACSDTLIQALRKNGVTGVFLVLNGQGIAGRDDAYAGVYLRDSDPDSTAADESDVHMLRGLPPLSRQLGLTLDSFWKACFTFEGGAANPSNAYFYRPIEAAETESNAWYCAYWSPAFSINGEADMAQITYSLPLLLDGTVYGVLGVEINQPYLAGKLNQGELTREEKLSYVLALTTDGGKNYQPMAYSGSQYRQYFTEGAALTPESADGIYLRFLSTKDESAAICGAAQVLPVYTPNTRFSGEEWVLIGMTDETSLYAFAKQIYLLLWLAMGLSLVLTLLVSMVVSRRTERPITRLVGDIRQSNPESRLDLKETGIAEIDALAGSIEQLSRDVAEAAAKPSRIIAMSGVPLYVFEQKKGDGAVRLSKGLGALLGLTSDAGVEMSMTAEQYASLHQALGQYRLPEDEDIYRMPQRWGGRCLRIRVMHTDGGVIGTMMDVTEDVERRLRIEHERDYDLLTGLLNRRAFRARSDELLREPETLKTAALLMMDLDNLKFINDTYGHDCGDAYIHAFAQKLQELPAVHCLLARRSGDEFLALLYGYEDQETIRRGVVDGWQKICQSTMTLPDDTTYRLRASAGLAWYPSQGQDIATLMTQADFAMYRVKRSNKGTLKEFDPDEYRREAYLFNGEEALNRLIEAKAVRFMLQPIVRVQDGTVLGYELLMRPQTPELPTPSALLRLASQQGKLQDIEKLTWLGALETAQHYLQNGLIPPGSKVFVNSIANQTLPREQAMELQARFPDVLPLVVMEVTESEDNNLVFTHDKVSFIRGLGGQVAIDDFGTGYNSEVALVRIEADYVKVDISLVRNVDTDGDKQALIRNLIGYARARGISVLAEGVETEGEMRELALLGVDQMQGYFFAKPSYHPITALSQELKDRLQQAPKQG